MSRQEIEDIEEGDEVWLNIRNIIMKRSSKKFDSKWKGFFKILKKKNHLNYEIDFPCIMRNYKIFYIFFLIKDPNNLLLE